MILPQPRTTRTHQLFPYTSHFRSGRQHLGRDRRRPGDCAPLPVARRREGRAPTRRLRRLPPHRRRLPSPSRRHGPARRPGAARLAAPHQRGHAAGSVGAGTVELACPPAQRPPGRGLLARPGVLGHPPVLRPPAPPRRSARFARRGARVPRHRAVRAGPPRPTPLLTDPAPDGSSEEHTSELQSLLRISYALFVLKKKKTRP